MTLPATGVLSFSQIRTELNLSGTVSMSQSVLRTLAGKPSGVVSFSDLLGKSLSGRRPGEVLYLDAVVEHAVNSSDGRNNWIMQPDAADPDQSIAIINGVSYPESPMIGTYNPGIDWGNGFVVDYNTFGVTLSYNTGTAETVGLPSLQQLLDNSGHLVVGEMVLSRGSWFNDDKFAWLIIKFDYPAGLAGFSGQRIHVGLKP